MTEIGREVAASAALKMTGDAAKVVEQFGQEGWQVGPPERIGQMAKTSCEPEDPHAWATHMRPGTGLEIAQCMVCGEFDWSRLNLAIQEQAARLVADNLKRKFEEHAELAAWRRMFSDLDRCQHGRHAPDICFSCPEGHSTGNLLLPAGEQIGYGIYPGQEYRVPYGVRPLPEHIESHDHTKPENWRRGFGIGIPKE